MSRSPHAGTGTTASLSAEPAWPPFTLPLTDLVAGSAAGAAQVLIGQPLDTIKVRSQTAPRGQFNGPMDVLRQTVAKEGLRGLYKGIAPPLVGVAAQNSLLFTAYASARRLVSPESQRLSLSQTAAAGALAGGVNTLLSSPIELLKIRQQANYSSSSSRGMVSIFKHLLRPENGGWRNGVFRGFAITFYREIPAYAAFYTAFEASKRRFAAFLLPPSDNEDDRTGVAPPPLPIWALMLSGSAGGIANWLASYPLDVIKSRVQLHDHLPLQRGWLGLRYIANQTRDIYRQEGATAFVRGLSPTLLRAIPAAAATFTTYEVVKGLLEG